MTVSAFDHPWLSGLLGDAELSALWSADAQWRHLRAFELAWTDGLEAIGRASPQAAADARARLADFEPDADRVSDAVARDGVAIPGLIRDLKAGMADSSALHASATSQDVVDTGLALTLRAVSEVLDSRLQRLLADLAALSDREGDRPLMGRTRMQAAQRITVADRIRAWRAPLQSQADRLGPLRGDVERLQFGGASGDRASLGSDAPAMAAHLAQALDLPDRGCWHTDRSGLAAYAGWLTGSVTASAKIGQDICLMAQQGIGEVALAGGGSSSAMPHKQNPIQAEVLVALARVAPGLNAAMQAATLHEQERSGVGWTAEWMVLPQLTMLAGRALTGARAVVGAIEAIGTAE